MSAKLQPPSKFPFPFSPYDIQEELMRQVFVALEDGKLAILESPTGTGKSLSIICGALTWLNEFNKQQKSRLEAELTAAESAVRDCESADDWFGVAGVRQQQTDAIRAVRRRITQLQHEEDRVTIIQERRKKAQQVKASDLPSEGIEMGMDELYKGAAQVRDAARRSIIAEGLDELPPEEQELLLSDDPEKEEGMEKEDEEDNAGVKIYYCSRTHSQLSQFVGELQKTVYGGAATRLVALSSRHNICVNPEVARLKSGALVNDRCLELQKQRGSRATSSCGSEGGSCKGSKRSKTSQGCPYNTQAGVRALADQVLCRVQDLEEVVSEARRSRSCPYYAARAALRDAQLVVVPYNTVLQASTRAACGISLRNACLIVDEAHNLLHTLAAVQEITITYTQVCCSRSQLQQYLQRYESRLSPRNLLYINQLLFMLRALLSAMTLAGQATTQKKTAPTPVVTQDVPEGQLVSIASFLSSCLVDNINLNQLLKYLEHSHLPNKLHGFTQLFQGSVSTSTHTVKTALGGSDNNSSTASFLSKLASDKQKNKENERSDPCAAPAEVDHVDPLVGNPFVQVVEFIHRLVSLNSSGRVLVQRDAALLKNCCVKYVVLDPAAHFHDLVKQCRSIILAGGTMKPTDEFRQQLFLSAGVCEDRLVEYSCGHVVPQDNILPVALTAGPTGLTLDLTHGSRSNVETVREVGRVLANLSSVVPAGMVVFLPSYQYAQHLLRTLREQGIWDKINAKKKVLEEPREASAVAAVLHDYAVTIRQASAISTNGSSCNKRCTGAVLFCVVGGKMSEGINFSDELGRCVVMVGLPYPNSTAPELKERMRHLDLTQPHRGSKSPGAVHYHNLCFRAVNQSIGRAIRHKGDYAAIVLLDQRYGHPATAAALPGWIAKALVVSAKFGPAQAAVAKFFARHKQRCLLQQQADGNPCQRV